MKSSMRAVASIFVSLLLVVGAAAPTHAASVSFDVTKLSAVNIVVKHNACYSTPVTMAHKKSGVGRWDVYTDISKSGAFADSVYYSSNGNTRTAKSQICPWSEADLGKYTVGPSNIWADAADSYDYVYRDDFTKGSFYVRAHVKSRLSAKRSGSKVTLTGTAKRYNLDSWGYKVYSPKKAKFQVKSGSSWKTIKTVDLKKGTAKLTVKSSSKKSYRFVTQTTSKTAAGTSATVKK